MKFSDLTLEQQNKVLKVLCGSLYATTRKLFIDLEYTIADFDRSKPRGHGESCMDGQDRLNNRLMASLIISDNGIPAHDTEALKWIGDVLK